MLPWRAMGTPPEPSSRALGTGSLLLGGLVGISLAAAVFAGDAWSTGGIVPVGGLAVAVLTGALVAVALGRLPVPRLGRSGSLLVSSLLALVVWIGASVAWSIVPDRSWDAFNKGVVYVAFLGLGVMLAAVAGRLATRLTAGLLATVTGAALAWSLLTKSVPALDDDGGLSARLSEPLDYWNAVALLAAAALALGVWLGTARTAGRASSALGALLVYGGALSIALSLSRVGVIAGVVVLAFVLALSERRAESGLFVGAALLPALAVSAWAFTRPALVEDGASLASRERDGLVLGLLVLAGGAVSALLARTATRRALTETARRRIVRALAVLGAVVALVLAALGAVAVASAVTSGTSCAEVANEPGRLGSLDLNSRWCWWNEAWDVFAQHAPAGAGAGSFEIARKRHRQDARAVRQPHSVPLQHLADGGVVGLALWLAVVAAAAGACACALRRLDGPERAAAVALVSLPLAYGTHSLVDYDWDFIGATAPTLTALGVLVAAGRPAGASRRRPLLGVGAVVLGLAVLASFAAPRVSERDVRASTDALIDGDLDRARDAALRAKALNPLAVEPLVALARVDERLGLLDDAERRYVQAVELQPQNPETWYTLGIFQFEARERMCAAYRFLNEAYTLDPAGRQWVPGGPFDIAKDAVNAGACE